MLLSLPASIRKVVLLWALSSSATASEESAKVNVLDRGYTADGKWFAFITRPDIQAPTWDITTNKNTSTAPGLWFIAPYEIKTQEIPGDAWVGPHIYDGNGDLVWSGVPFFRHWNVFDFGVSQVNGETHLKGLEWHEQRGVVLDNSYQLVRTAPSVGLHDTFQNMHGFHVVDDGKKALVQTVQRWITPKEVTLEYLGFNATCEGHYQGFREFELQPGDGAKLLFDWNGRKIGLNESTYRNNNAQSMCAGGWDLLHVNAVDKCPDGDYLLSARHTDAVYKISHVTGDIVWRLGGSMSSFEMGNDAKFSRQHHARCHAQNDTHTTVSIFDNAVGEHFQAPTRRVSRGVVLTLDMEKMTANVQSQFENPWSFLTDGRGSFQLLPDGNAFLNWAMASRISEHTADGEVVLQAMLKANVDTYRAYKSPWIGKPVSSPDVHAEIEWRDHEDEVEGKVSQAITKVAMSWNGATEISNWNVFGVNGEGKKIKMAANVPKTGFETALEYSDFATNVYAEALDIHGNLLGSSSSGEGNFAPGQANTKPSAGGKHVKGVAIGSGGGVLALLIVGLGIYFYIHRRRRALASRAEGKGRGEYRVVEQQEELEER